MTSDFKTALELWVEESFNQICNMQYRRGADLEVLKIAKDRFLQASEREPAKLSVDERGET